MYYGRTGITMVDARAINYDEFEDLQKGSIDFYVAIRNFYRQRRDSDIKNEDIEGAAPAPSPDTGPRVR
ncbi:MAG: hypothetical protein EXQ90_03815 [Rhodospirillales bacterium]|nr:hypothetical protein [Rhodospirillales bacterium]